MPKCSIIIPVFNKANLTRQCLDRLFTIANFECPFEVIVVDDGSTDSTQSMLASYGSRVRVVSHSKNQAFATSCNDGAKIATGQYLVFLNNDTIPFVGWLEALVRTIEARPQIGLVSSKLLYPNGTIQHAGMAMCQDRQPRLIYVGFPGDHPVVNKPRKLQLASGACNLIPRDLFFKLGCFDTDYINGYEDVDLCMRVNASGYEVHYCPESTLIHLESVSEGRFRFEAHSAKLFRERWGHKAIPDDLRIYVEDGMIQIEYYANYLEFRISPELGVVKTNDGFGPIEQLLATRAQQVYTLIRENNVLRSTGSVLAVPLTAAG